MTCPNGKFSTGGASECTSCTQHHFCDGDQIPCAEGQEQSLLGQSDCIPCPDGTWSDPGFGCVVDTCGKGY